MHKSEMVREIEHSIKEIADQFVIEEDRAFYFRNESDIQCRLFACLSQNIGDTELVHAEQRIEYSRSWHDLVVWKPGLKEKAAEHWGDYNSDFAISMPDLILAAIEIKHLYGGISKTKEYVSYKSICRHQDIKNLINRAKNGCKYAYFLMFWDEDVNKNDKYSKYFDKIQKAFTLFRKKHRRIRILCKTRDGLQLNLGF